MARAALSLALLALAYVAGCRAGSSFGNVVKAGITTTFRVEKSLQGDWAGTVKWWVDWHCRLLGFNRIYMCATLHYVTQHCVTTLHYVIIILDNSTCADYHIHSDGLHVT